MISLDSIFQTSNNIVIGAIHLPPLLGYTDFPGIDIATKHALADLRAFEQGGVEGVIFENNYDIPHTEHVAPGTITIMALVGKELRKKTHLPLGVSVLWNDYETAFSLAVALDLQFIRVPVFVDTVETAYGIIKESAQDVMHIRKKLGAEHIAIFTDIHVKHATLLSTLTLEESAEEALHKKSDALIITGKWTGDAPDIQELSSLRKKFPEAPLLLGSGVSYQNAKELFTYANGAIVSSSLKEETSEKHTVNLVPHDIRISKEKVSYLMHQIKNPA